MKRKIKNIVRGDLLRTTNLSLVSRRFAYAAHQVSQDN